MPIFSSAFATAAKRRKNHLYLIKPASCSLSATEPMLSSAVISTVVVIASLLKAHRSEASSQPESPRRAPHTVHIAVGSPAGVCAASDRFAVRFDGTAHFGGPAPYPSLRYPRVCNQPWNPPFLSVCSNGVHRNLYLSHRVFSKGQALRGTTVHRISQSLKVR